MFECWDGTPTPQRPTGDTGRATFSVASIQQFPAPMWQWQKLNHILFETSKRYSLKRFPCKGPSDRNTV
jgi:hypothetical protein